MRRLMLLLLIGVVAACGGSSSGPSGPTAASVAAQSGDVPNGMVKCSLSGDIQTFIHNEQSPDPSTSKTAANQWTDLQKSGATSAYVAIYTDSKSHCGDFASARTDPAAATYKLVVNFVVQFKDEKSAASAYANGSVFGVSAPSLHASAQAIEGTKTGLSANSVVVSQAIANQSFYIALWQNKSFAVFLAVVNLDPTASKKVATSENGRIA